MDENTIVVTDELGNEVEYEILFTFENEENGHQYVVYFDPEKDEPEAQAAIFDDEGGLFPIETPEEWEMVEEVFQSFMAESEEGHECCGKHKEGGCCHENDHECCGGHHHDEDHECCGGHHHDENHECCKDN